MLKWLCAVHVLFIVIPTASALPDWLVEDVTTQTTLTKTPRGTLLLSNGLISREFLLIPDFTTIDFYSHEKQASLLRAMSPEAVISLNDVTYNISGVLTGIPRAYLNRTALAHDMHANPRAFHYISHSTCAPQAPFTYKPKRGAPKDIVWPPMGLRLDVRFRAPMGAPSVHQEVTIVLHYEMYNGIPLMAKWLTVEAPSNFQENIKLSIIAVEVLAVNWQWAQPGYNWLSVETDQPHGTKVQWSIDPLQPLMPGSFQYNVACSFKPVPSLSLKEFSESFRVHELVHASSDPERVGLALKRKLKLLAPQTQENPIFFHMTNSSDQAVRNVIDELSEVGFEMLIYSFGSGFHVESNDEKYLKDMKSIISYANSKGIEVGGYDLIDWTRTVPQEWMADTHSQYKGACYASGWADFLLDRVLNFINQTGLSMLETDGPYPGYQCHSTNHSHHHNVQDSVYKQLMLQGNFFKILQEKGIYINQPDKYFYHGGSKTAMGYKEHQFSLPRWQDLSVSRQGMFDDTFLYTPTVGWMFLPLVEYHHGGGAAAIFEPMSQHMVEYEWGLAQYFGAGVAACYRGFRIYDSEETKILVKKWVDFYKIHRGILTSDIIHVQRADMQGIDCFMHVNPRLQEKALAMVFNPTDLAQQTNLTLPLYYTGLHASARVSQEGASPVTMAIDRKYNIEISVGLKPLQITWFLIQ